MSRYTVTAERGTDRKIWVLQCVEHPGAISQTRTLAKAQSLMAEAIGFVADVDPADVEIDLQLALPSELQAEVLAARTAVSELEATQRQTAALSRSAARHLVDAGLSGTDTAVALGISPQRVSQLLNTSPTKI